MSQENTKNDILEYNRIFKVDNTGVEVIYKGALLMVDVSRIEDYTELGEEFINKENKVLIYLESGETLVILEELNKVLDKWLQFQKIYSITGNNKWMN